MKLSESEITPALGVRKTDSVKSPVRVPERVLRSIAGRRLAKPSHMIFMHLDKVFNNAQSVAGVLSFRPARLERDAGSEGIEFEHCAVALNTCTTQAGTDKNFSSAGGQFTGAGSSETAEGLDVRISKCQ